MRRISDVAITLLALVALTGCSSSSALERYPRGQYAGNQGDSSDLVFTMAEGRSAPDWEFSRLDDSLNIRGPYQTDTPPDLSDLRFIYLNPRPDQIYYYQRYYRH
jgi:hypothetical protein